MMLNSPKTWAMATAPAFGRSTRTTPKAMDTRPVRANIARWLAVSPRRKAMTTCDHHGLGQLVPEIRDRLGRREHNQWRHRVQHDRRERPGRIG